MCFFWRVSFSGLDAELLLMPQIGFWFGLGGELEHELLKNQSLAGRIGAQGRVGAGHEAQGARKFAAGFVPARLTDEIIRGKRRDTEALPQHLPDGTRVTHILLKHNQHLAEGASQRVKVSDSRVFALTARENRL